LAGLIGPVWRLPDIRRTRPPLFVATLLLAGAGSEACDSLLRTEEPGLSPTRIENAAAQRAVGVAAVGEDGLVGRFSPELLLDL
jgi:hypothetical protein